MSFSDCSFSPPEISEGNISNINFFGSIFKDKAMFVKTLQRDMAPWVGELSFQQADLRHLIVSSGDPNLFQLQSEQTGQGLWGITSDIILMNARIHTLTFKNVSLKGTTDLRGAKYLGGADSIQFLNVDFNNLKLDFWPVGKVLAPPETRDRLVNVFESPKEPNKIASRSAFFDLLATSDYYLKWLQQPEKERLPSYRNYLGYHLWNFILKPFWFISGYGTSLPRTFCFGGVLVFGFAVAFFFLDFRYHRLVRIEKPLEFKTRLSETPILSFGETPIPTTERGNLLPTTFWAKFLQVAIPLWQKAKLSLLLSLNTVAKIGFGDIRVQIDDDGPKILRRIAWAAWGIGYLWYGLLLYTFIANPVLKGVF